MHQGQGRVDILDARAVVESPEMGQSAIDQRPQALAVELQTHAEGLDRAVQIAPSQEFVAFVFVEQVVVLVALAAVCVLRFRVRQLFQEFLSHRQMWKHLLRKFELDFGALLRHFSDLDFCQLARLFARIREDAFFARRRLRARRVVRAPVLFVCEQTLDCVSLLAFQSLLDSRPEGLFLLHPLIDCPVLLPGELSLPLMLPVGQLLFLSLVTDLTSLARPFSSRSVPSGPEAAQASAKSPEPL